MKEKQIETMFADISDTLHKHIELEPYQYLSVEYAKKYNNMRVSIDVPSIVNELYDMGYRKQVESAWIAVPLSDVSIGKAYKCSKCGKIRYGSRLSPYCSECGARLKGE